MVQGMDVRLVGSDAGEKVTSSQEPWRGSTGMRRTTGWGTTTTSTRSFRRPPKSSGGSSGSPVLDIKGNVVALNARLKATCGVSFFLRFLESSGRSELIQAVRMCRAGHCTRPFSTRPSTRLGAFGLPSGVEADLRDAKAHGQRCPGGRARLDGRGNERCARRR